MLAAALFTTARKRKQLGVCAEMNVEGKSGRHIKWTVFSLRSTEICKLMDKN